MKIDRALVLQTFLAETEEHLATVEELLLLLEARGPDAEHLDGLFRIAHTLKGSAATFGFHDIAEFAHAWEDSLEAIARTGAPLTRDAMNLLLEIVDTLRALVPATVALDTLKAQVRHLADTTTAGAKARQGAATSGSAAPGAAAERAGAPGTTPAQAQAGTPGAGGPGPGGTRRSDPAKSGDPARDADRETPARTSAVRGRTLRVETQKLDRILSLTTEVAIAHGRLGEALTHPDQTAVELHHDAARLQLELQEQVMRLRMIPVGPIFRQYARAVRDAADELGKEAVLEVRGDDVEVDLMVVDLIRDPLLHMVRNALAHGIELPAEREAKGKPREGVVRLEASHDAGMVVVKVSDDGAGLSREKILARAGLSRAAAERMSDEEVYALVFTPHFSTSDAVDAVSGRGVGLDVVRKNVDALRGTIQLASTPGAGTTFTLRLPLTVAIIEGFGVAASNETYVIPMEFVEEVVQLSAEDARADRPTGVMELRGKPLPFLRLRQHFHLPKCATERESVVVLRHGEARIGLVVDALLGQGQTVIKPLAKIFQGVPGIAGSAILGNGRVALIIDAPGFIRAALGGRTRALGRGADGPAAAASEGLRAAVTAAGVEASPGAAVDAGVQGPGAVRG